jgi:hypothetical protein
MGILGKRPELCTGMEAEALNTIFQITDMTPPLQAAGQSKTLMISSQAGS